MFHDNNNIYIPFKREFEGKWAQSQSRVFSNESARDKWDGKWEGKWCGRFKQPGGSKL